MAWLPLSLAPSLFRSFPTNEWLSLSLSSIYIFAGTCGLLLSQQKTICDVIMDHAFSSYRYCAQRAFGLRGCHLDWRKSLVGILRSVSPFFCCSSQSAAISFSKRRKEGETLFLSKSIFFAIAISRLFSPPHFMVSLNSHYDMRIVDSGDIYLDVL